MSLDKLDRQSAPACIVALRPPWRIGEEKAAFRQGVLNKTIEFQGGNNCITAQGSIASTETYLGHYLAKKEFDITNALDTCRKLCSEEWLCPFHQCGYSVMTNLQCSNHLHHGNQSACFNRIQKETVQLVLTKRD